MIFETKKKVLKINLLLGWSVLSFLERVLPAGGGSWSSRRCWPGGKRHKKFYGRKLPTFVMS